MGTPSGSRLVVAVVEETERLDEVADGWRQLAVERGNAFITPEWFHAWSRHYGDRESPLVAIARDSEGCLRGILPLTVTRRGRTPTARFAGSGLGDYFHPVCKVEDEPQVASAFAEALRGSPRIPTIMLENVGARSAWWTELSGHLYTGADPLVDRPMSLPTARLAGLTWDDYLAKRSRNLRSQVKRKHRALERDHALAVRWSTGEQVRDDIADLFKLHDARWSARPGRSSLTGDRARAFHADFAQAAHQAGWLRLCFLELDGERVAAWYGWRVGERFAYYQAGFDPAWGEQSVGFVLFAATIRAAIEEGASEYDMLLGDEPFKLRFADSERTVCTALIAPRWRPYRLIAGAETSLRRMGGLLPVGAREPLKRAARGMLGRLPLARRR